MFDLRKDIVSNLDDALANLQKASQLKNVKEAIAKLTYIHGCITNKRNEIRATDITEGTYVNGYWVSPGDTIQTIQTFSDEELLTEIKKRMNRCTPARA